MYGLVFDVDGVLGDTEAIVCRATIRMFRERYGIDMRPEDFTEFIGTGAVRYVEGPAQRYGLDIDVGEAVALRHQYFVETLETGVDISFPGALQFIGLMRRQADWKLAIATSSPGEKSRATLRAARVPYELFDAYVHGDDIAYKKPHPEIYLRAAEALALAPQACVAIEDAINGIAAAKQAGMACIAVTNSFPRERLDRADRVVDSLKEINLVGLRRLVE